MKRALALTIALATFGCTAVRTPRPAVATPAPVPSLYETQRQITEYIDSGRYARDFAAVVAKPSPGSRSVLPKYGAQPSCSTSTKPRFRTGTPTA
jgi:hypothetical protein